MFRKENAVKRSVKNAEATLYETEIALDQAEEKLYDMTHTIEDVEDFTRRYYTQPEEMLPEASTFETAKNYRDKKIVPLLAKILEDIRSFK